MPVTDLKFYWSFQHSCEPTQEVRDNELRQTDFFSSHGPSAFAYVPPMRQSLSRQLSDKTGSSWKRVGKLMSLDNYNMASNKDKRVFKEAEKPV